MNCFLNMLKTTHLYTNVKYLMLRSLIMKETNEHKVCSCCGKPHYAKGYCRNCYDRYHRTGNPEKQPTNKLFVIINSIVKANIFLSIAYHFS